MTNPNQNTNFLSVSCVFVDPAYYGLPQFRWVHSSRRCQAVKLCVLLCYLFLCVHGFFMLPVSLLLPFLCSPKYAQSSFVSTVPLSFCTRSKFLCINCSSVLLYTLEVPFYRMFFCSSLLPVSLLPLFLCSPKQTQSSFVLTAPLNLFSTLAAVSPCLLLSQQEAWSLVSIVFS